MMKITVLGTSNFFSLNRITACFVVSFDDNEHNLLVEAPDRLCSVLNKNGNGLAVKDINHVFVSHVHGDHMNGLEMLGAWKLYAEKKKVNLYVAKSIAKNVWKRLEPSMGKTYDDNKITKRKMDDFFSVHPLEPKANKEHTIDIDGKPVKIQIKKAKHSVPSYAIKIEYDGKSIGYSSDTRFDKGIIRFLKGCDMIIHEVEMNGPHTTYEQLLTLPKRTLDKLYVIHYSDEIEDKLKSLQSEGKLKMLEDGKTYTL